MKNKIIIGIAGYKGSGKDTAANYLKDKLSARVFHLALPVKQTISNVFGIPMNYMEDRDLKESSYRLSNGEITTIRKIMQEVGNKFREIDKDVWLSKCVRDINNDFKYSTEGYKYDTVYYLIPDVRFKNEADKCDITILLEREGLEKTDTDASENGLNDYKFDYVIRNNGKDLSQFYQELNKIKLD